MTLVSFPLSLLLFLVDIASVYLDSTNSTCRSNCSCTRDRIHCHDLNTTETAMVFEQLATSTLGQLATTTLEQLTISTLEQLTITQSRLFDLSQLPALPKLSRLDLSHNLIVTLNIPIERTFSKVIYLNLENNRIENLNRDQFLMFPNVEVLYLRQNRISAIDWEAFRLYRLKQLYLGDNLLTSLSEHMLRFTPNLELLDLHGNRLLAIQSSHFFFAQRLRQLDLSRNRIRRFDYDSFAPLYQLDSLDLSSNNLSSIPDRDLRHLAGLRMLNLSDLPIERIERLTHPTVEELHLSNCTMLRVIESYSFSAMKSLRYINLSNNPSLIFLSPLSFSMNANLASLDLSNTGLVSLSQSFFPIASSIRLTGTRLRCGCVGFMDHVEQVVDLPNVTCTTGHSAAISLSSLSRSSTSTENECNPEPVLPFGNTITAMIGSSVSIDCSTLSSQHQLSWLLPNGSNVIATSPDQQPNEHFLFDQEWDPSLLARLPVRRSRVTISTERLRIEAVLQSDAGRYRCIVSKDVQSYSSAFRDVQLTVKLPNIFIYAMEVGSHYVALAWNDSLPIQATDRVRLFLGVRDGGGTAIRAVQLSLHSPWLSYNMLRLKPNTNYSFCLSYTMLDESERITSNDALYEVCVNVQTAKSLSFWLSFDIRTLMVMLCIALSICAVCIGQCIHRRMHIWQQTKHRSRINQSISGQSFISNTSSNGIAITYENDLPMCSSSLMAQSSRNNNNRRRSSELLENDEHMCSSSSMAQSSRNNNNRRQSSELLENDEL